MGLMCFTKDKVFKNKTKNPWSSEPPTNSQQEGRWGTGKTQIKPFPLSPQGPAGDSGSRA